MYNQIMKVSIFICISYIFIHCPSYKMCAFSMVNNKNSIEFLKLRACTNEYHNQTLIKKYDDYVSINKVINMMDTIIKLKNNINININYERQKDMKLLNGIDMLKYKNYNINNFEITNGKHSKDNINNDNKLYGINFKKNTEKKQQARDESFNRLKDKVKYEERQEWQEQWQQQRNFINILQQQFIYQIAIKYKQISHVTLFTCRKQSLLSYNGQMNGTIYLHSSVTFEEMIFFKHLYNPSSIMEAHKYPEKNLPHKQQQQPIKDERKRVNSLMLKIIQIDHLNEESLQRPQHHTTLINNWLDNILIRGNIFKQIVIVNMECSRASRILLEMVSKKSLFNGRYHWLLLVNEKQKKNVNDNINNGTDDLEKIKNKTYRAEKDMNINEKPSSITLTELRSSMTETKGNNSIYSMKKFLAKLNININTELIMAKLHNTQHTQHMKTTTKTVKYCQENQYNNKFSIINITSSSNFCYYLYDIWSPGRQYGGKLNITLVGNFTLQNGLQLQNSYRYTSTVRRRINMKLAQIRCMIVLTNKKSTDTLEHYLTNPYDPHIDSMNRFNYALISFVRDMFNFKMIVTKISSWGYLRNGQFDGMIGALIRNQADIGGSPIFFRLERSKVIDYTIYTWTARPCFIFRHPRSTNKDRIVFLQPFTENVWHYTAFLAIFTIILLWILTTLERNLKNSEKHKNIADIGRIGHIKNKESRYFQMYSLQYPMAGNDYDDNIKKSNKQLFGINVFLEALLFYVGAICQQGLSYSTNFFSGRCIVMTSILFSFAIYQFYLASIVGTLLMEKPKTIRTLKDLIQTSLDIGIEDIPYNHDFFLRTKDPVAQELYVKKVSHLINSTSDKAQNYINLKAPIIPANMSKAAEAKIYHNTLHSHSYETGAHAKSNDASNWYEPEYGVQKIKNGHFAFHVDVATAYKIIADTFTEKEICDLTEIELFPMQKMMSIVQKNSPLRKMISYGLRRATEVGLVDYQRKVWHSPKPSCVKQLHTEDLQVDLETFTSVLLLFMFGCILSLLILVLEIVHQKLIQY